MPAYLREYQRVIDDGLSPANAFMPLGENAEPRFKAAIEVMRRLPEAPYAQLKAAVDTFRWFLPHAGADGVVGAFVTTHYKPTDRQSRSYARVVYLSPTLFGKDPPLIVVVVAMQLARIILGYDPNDPTAAQPRDAQLLKTIAEWGFAEEVKSLPDSVLKSYR